MRLEFPKAIEDFTQAVSLNRKCAKAYAGRALVYSAMAAIERKKADEMEKKLQQQPLLPATASPEFKKQKELADEQHLADQTGLAKCLDDVKELWQKSIEDATAAIAANRHLASAYVTRALAYAKQRATANAMADFTAAIREDSKLAIAYDNRGVLLFNDHHLDAAIKDFEEAFRLQPASWQYAYRLYLCYQQKHDPVLAAQWLKTYQDNAKRLQPGVAAGLADAPGVLLAAPNKNPLLAPEPVDADPLKKAQKELEDLLDATAEK